jgi:hypothetical protein
MLRSGNTPSGRMQLLRLEQGALEKGFVRTARKAKIFAANGPRDAVMK